MQKMRHTRKETTAFTKTSRKVKVHDMHHTRNKMADSLKMPDSRKDSQRRRKREPLKMPTSKKRTKMPGMQQPQAVAGRKPKQERR